MFMINKFGQVIWQCMPMFYVGSKCPLVWGECLSYSRHNILQFYNWAINNSKSIELFSVYKLASKQNFFYAKKKNTLVHLLHYYHSQYVVQLTIVGSTCNISSTPQIIASSVGTTDCVSTFQMTIEGKYIFLAYTDYGASYGTVRRWTFRRSQPQINA